MMVDTLLEAMQARTVEVNRWTSTCKDTNVDTLYLPIPQVKDSVVLTRLPAPTPATSPPDTHTQTLVTTPGCHLCSLPTFGHI